MIASSIFDPRSGQTEHSGSMFGSADADSRSRMPQDLIDGAVGLEESNDLHALAAANAEIDPEVVPADEVEEIEPEDSELASDEPQVDKKILNPDYSQPLPSVPANALQVRFVMRIHAGTMGFGYSDWAGVFYPRGVRPGDFLAHYAKYFDAVELDTTFHATPPAERVRRWADVTPEHFCFCAKAPKSVTHDRSLSNKSGELRRFIDVMSELGGKLSAILIQLPPSCGFDQIDALQALLESLPNAKSLPRFAVEFRNPTWGKPQTLELLRAHRCALVSAEYLDRPARLHLTTDFTYIRLIGEHERFDPLNEERLEMTQSLEWWKGELSRHEREVRDAFVLFNNNYSGYAIQTCRRFRKLMGQDVREDDVAPTLFG